MLRLYSHTPACLPQLVQIEHALAAVNAGATCLGIKGEFDLLLRDLMSTDSTATLTYHSTTNATLSLPHSIKCHCPRSGEVTPLSPRRHHRAREARHHLSQHRHGLQWHGTRLQGARCKGEKERADLLEDLWRVPSNEGFGAGDCGHHARGDTTRVSVACGDAC